MTWIKCTDRLPYDDSLVLACIASLVTSWPAYHDEYGVWRWASGDRIREPVLCWMPLPQKPEEYR